MDFLNKELVDSFVYTTLDENRTGEAEVRINGRDYTKYGTYQAVTLVGNVYNVLDPSINNYKKILLVGISKQHPCDTILSRQVAIELANVRANVDPIMRIEVDKTFTRFDFVEMMYAYVGSMNLHFVKTREEIVDEYGEDALQKYNR